jgi:hypothetical protein
MFERYVMRSDNTLTTDQYVAVVMAYEELRFVAIVNRDHAFRTCRTMAREAASKARRLVSAFGERPPSGER